MILDNLFASFGSVGTASALMVILMFVGIPAVGSVVCPMSALKRIQPRGR
jgi:hypothetical protein